MSKPLTFKYCILLAVFGHAMSCSPKLDHVQSSLQPNVEFILVDDLGWNDLGCYGSKFHETKNIDRLAQNGTRFTNAYAASPVCSPTRAALLTGKYPSRVNITDWIPGNDPKNQKLLGPQDANELKLEEITMAESIQQHGYKNILCWEMASWRHWVFS
jgi:arylsulfatase A-like enzyme